MSDVDRPVRLLIAAVLLVLLFPACRWLRGLAPPPAPSATDGGHDALAVVTFASVRPILQRSCAMTCHDGRSSAADDFVFRDDGDLKARLLDVAPRTVPRDCQDRPLVVPGRPELSLLVAMVEEPDGPRAGCAERMPHSCPGRRPCLTETEILTVRAWIEAGALR